MREKRNASLVESDDNITEEILSEGMPSSLAEKTPTPAHKPRVSNNTRFSLTTWDLVTDSASPLYGYYVTTTSNAKSKTRYINAELTRKGHAKIPIHSWQSDTLLHLNAINYTDTQLIICQDTYHELMAVLSIANENEIAGLTIRMVLPHYMSLRDPSATQIGNVNLNFWQCGKLFLSMFAILNYYGLIDHPERILAGTVNKKFPEQLEAELTKLGILDKPIQDCMPTLEDWSIEKRSEIFSSTLYDNKTKANFFGYSFREILKITNRDEKKLFQKSQREKPVFYTEIDHEELANQLVESYESDQTETVQLTADHSETTTAPQTIPRTTAGRTRVKLFGKGFSFYEQFEVGEIISLIKQYRKRNHFRNALKLKLSQKLTTSHNYTTTELNDKEILPRYQPRNLLILLCFTFDLYTVENLATRKAAFSPKAGTNFEFEILKKSIPKLEMQIAESSNVYPIQIKHLTLYQLREMSFTKAESGLRLLTKANKYKKTGQISEVSKAEIVSYILSDVSFATSCFGCRDKEVQKLIDAIQPTQEHSLIANLAPSLTTEPATQPSSPAIAQDEETPQRTSLFSDLFDNNLQPLSPLPASQHEVFVYDQDQPTFYSPEPYNAHPCKRVKTSDTSGYVNIFSFFSDSSDDENDDALGFAPTGP